MPPQSQCLYSPGPGAQELFLPCGQRRQGCVGQQDTVCRVKLSAHEGSVHLPSSPLPDSRWQEPFERPLSPTQTQERNIFLMFSFFYSDGPLASPPSKGLVWGQVTHRGTGAESGLEVRRASRLPCRAAFPLTETVPGATFPL